MLSLFSLSTAYPSACSTPESLTLLIKKMGRNGQISGSSNTQSSRAFTQKIKKTILQEAKTEPRRQSQGHKRMRLEPKPQERRKGLETLEGGTSSLQAGQEVQALERQVRGTKDPEKVCCELRVGHQSFFQRLQQSQELFVLSSWYILECKHGIFRLLVFH